MDKLQLRLHDYMVTGTRLISTFCPLQALERVNVQMETRILLVLVLKPLKIEVFFIYNLKKKRETCN